MLNQALLTVTFSYFSNRDSWNLPIIDMDWMVGQQRNSLTSFVSRQQDYLSMQWQLSSLLTTRTVAPRNSWSAFYRHHRALHMREKESSSLTQLLIPSTCQFFKVPLVRMTQRMIKLAVLSSVL